MTPENIHSYYQESFDFLQQRKTRQVKQLGLLNNLTRDDQTIASTMLLTLFNRILSNLYDDKMQVKFVPGEEIDQKRINSLNLLAQNDYREMEKAKLDYDWSWDTLFFGRGYMETLRFDKKTKLIQPHVINPLVFGYDPYFENVQEWRYYWKWITKSKYELDKLITAGIIKGVKSTSEIPSGIEPYIWDYKVKRDQARKGVPPYIEAVNGDVFQIFEFYGYKDGEKHVFWVDKNFSKILYESKLDLKDGDEIVAPDGTIIATNSNWPIVVKEAFREPHSSIVFSVADILDDKHRAESALLNLMYMAAKDKANPLYGYNPDKVKDVTQLFSRQINQHIPMDDNTSMWPLNTQDPLPPGLMSFLQMLKAEANDPIGTGMALSPAKKGKQSATETAIQQQLNDLAQSLQSKVMQFGEKEFWSHWYHRYKRYTKAGDIKVATITGVKGMTFEKIDLGDIKTKYPPGIMIFSAKDAEYKELVLRRDLMQLYPQLSTTLSPDGMRNFNKFVFLPKFLHDPTIIDILIPKTIDEVKAEEENDSLNKNELPNVLDTDNHEQHMAVHYMAKKTWATWTHIAWHEELMGMQKKQQMDQAQQEQVGDKGNAPPDKGGSKPKVGEKKKSPVEATASLKTEINPKNAIK